MIASILFALLPLVSAIVTPNTPDGSTVVNEGGDLDIAWAADDTGSWTNVTIQLMTGDNFQMIPLQTLATGVDGTSVTTFSTPVPDVEPNSKIYFLQFTNNGETEATWTTRFTIAAADGSTTEPEQATQSNGDAIPWGIGAVVGGDSSSNSTATGAGSMSSMSMSMSASMSTSTGSGVTNYQPSSTGSAIANPSNGSGPSRSASSAMESASESASAVISGSAASASTSPNGAGKLATGGFVGLAGIFVGLFL